MFIPFKHSFKNDAIQIKFYKSTSLGIAFLVMSFCCTAFFLYSCLSRVGFVEGHMYLLEIIAHSWRIGNKEASESVLLARDFYGQTRLGFLAVLTLFDPIGANWPRMNRLILNATTLFLYFFSTFLVAKKICGIKPWIFFILIPFFSTPFIVASITSDTLFACATGITALAILCSKTTNHRIIASAILTALAVTSRFDAAIYGLACIMLLIYKASSLKVIFYFITTTAITLFSYKISGNSLLDILETVRFTVETFQASSGGTRSLAGQARDIIVFLISGANIIIYPLSIWGLMVLSKEKKWFNIIFLITPIFLFFFIYRENLLTTRYILSILPFFLILSANGLQASLKKRLSTIISGVIIVIGYLIMMMLPVVEMNETPWPISGQIHVINSIPDWRKIQANDLAKVGGLIDLTTTDIIVSADWNSDKQVEHYFMSKGFHPISVPSSPKTCNLNMTIFDTDNGRKFHFRVWRPFSGITPDVENIENFINNCTAPLHKANVNQKKSVLVISQYSLNTAGEFIYSSNGLPFYFFNLRSLFDDRRIFTHWSSADSFVALSIKGDFINIQNVMKYIKNTVAVRPWANGLYYDPTATKRVLEYQAGRLN